MYELELMDVLGTKEDLVEEPIFQSDAITSLHGEVKEELKKLYKKRIQTDKINAPGELDKIKIKFAMPFLKPLEKMAKNWQDKWEGNGVAYLKIYGQDIARINFPDQISQPEPYVELTFYTGQKKEKEMLWRVNQLLKALDTEVNLKIVKLELEKQKTVTPYRLENQLAILKGHSLEGGGHYLGVTNNGFYGEIKPFKIISSYAYH